MVLLFIGYIVLIFGLLAALFFYRKRIREGRFPIPMDLQALRRPGESLSLKMAKLMDRFQLQFCLLLLTPLLGFALPFWIAHLAGVSVVHVGTLLSSLALVAVGLILTLPPTVKTAETMRDYGLGLFGERLVADQLGALCIHGYQVFHDVPCMGGSGPFNLDHVVVGKGQVVVIETKTYRKPKNVQGADHKVNYDGVRLCWPDSTSTAELEQALRNATWLREELKKRLNLSMPVRAALTFPGWFVTGNSPKAPVLVVSTKQLPSFIRQRFQSDPITPDQEQLVCNHMRSLCQTVNIESMPEFG